MQRLLLALPTGLLVLGLIAASAQQPAAGNPITNGSFEELAATGFPVDWEPVGQGVGVSPDARTGQRSLRISRGEGAGPETGLNRAWRAHSGQRGAQLAQTKGGVVFWYKATKSDNARLVFYVIPMSDKPLEDTGNPRKGYDIPEAHVGDGQWHQGRLKYDFADDPKVKWVQIAPRLTGGPGELLLDDISWVAQVGPWISLSKAELVESERKPGRECDVVVELKNVGDAPAEEIRVEIEPPQGLRVKGAPTATAEGIAPDASTEASFRLLGVRDAPGAIALRASAGDGREAGGLVQFAPELGEPVIETERFILAMGEETTVRAIVKNEGSAIIRNLRAMARVDGALQHADGRWRTADELAPGRELVLEWPLRAAAEARQAEVRVTVVTENAGSGGAAANIVVAGMKGARRMHAVVEAEAEEGALSLRFLGSSSWLGVTELWVRRERGPWRLAGKMPRLSRLVYRDGEGEVHDVPLGFGSAGSTEGDTVRLKRRHKDPEGAQWWLTAEFAPAPGQTAVDWRYEITAPHDTEVLCFEGPMLYVGEGSFGSEKTEAVFPGMEWLVSGEDSSSTLDDHTPNHVRYVPHPNKVTVPAMGVQKGSIFVGMTWDPYHKWDGENDRMSAVFDSPARHEGHAAHLMGLFVPSVPEWVDEHERIASKPYQLKEGQTLTIAGRIVASAQAEGPLVALKDWFRGGYQRPPEPLDLPHADTLEGEVAWNIESYLDPEVLWVPEERLWWTSKGAGPLLSRKGRSAQFVQDLWIASQVIEDEALARRCRERAEAVLGEMGGVGLDFSFFVGRPDDAMMGQAGSVSGLLGSQWEDGSWRYFANRIGTGVFEGKDYRELGPHNAAEVGTCARSAYSVLRFARMTGDARARERGLAALEFMERFTVPRAAQVWEVPVHTPDILAAADAMDAYLEGYRLTGDQHYLDEAVEWAWRGLPFVYAWHTEEFPFMRYASIPVFGATWYVGSWIGRPVQWNGLRYAMALLKLSEYDQSLDWPKIARGITVSGMYQQATEGEDRGLWPDSISALDATKSAWVFAPYQINQLVYKMLGREVEPQTVALGAGETKTRLNTVAKVTAARLEGEELTASLVFPEGETSYVLLASIGEPEQVLLNGTAVEATPDFGGEEPAYRYNSAARLLAVRIVHRGRDTLRIVGAGPARSEMLPEVARRLEFEFEGGSFEGFGAHNHSEILGVTDGALRVRITGGDPYLVRPFLQVDGDDYGAVLVRMAVSGGEAGQFYWTTAASPGFAEDKVVHIPIQADGKMHTYRLEVGAHALWKGHKITAVRLDPTNGEGGVGTEALVDFVKGVR
ncbi:MAG: hypothetical protein ACE5R4_14990 [Armatimonadota bacterium]